ncbi:hypothetical protein JCM6882_007395 [Rhodosporidiobolus microsporus]
MASSATPAATSATRPARRSYPWTAAGETDLVQAVQALGEQKWKEVKEQLVAKGHPDRGADAIKQHHMMLSSRAAARGGKTAHRSGRGTHDLTHRLGNLQQKMKEPSADQARWSQILRTKEAALETIQDRFPHLKSLAANAAAHSSASTSGGSGATLAPSTSSSNSVQIAASTQAFPPSQPQASLPSFNAARLSTSAPYAGSPILPQRVVSIATQTVAFPFSSACSSHLIQPDPVSRLSTSGTASGDSSGSTGVALGKSTRVRRVRAIFDEGRTVLKRMRRVFELVEEEE